MQKETELISFCGLNCADYNGHSGIIRDIARDLCKELRAIIYEKFASFLSTYSFGKDFKKYDE